VIVRYCRHVGVLTPKAETASGFQSGGVPSRSGVHSHHQTDNSRRVAAQLASDQRADAQGVSLCGLATGQAADHHSGIDIAGDRWSDVNPAPTFPYVRTGAYNLVNLSAEYEIASTASVVFGFKNLTDDNDALAWGFPQPGRAFYFKTRVGL
jgi:outer membrane cobalamin receptor